jgi:hypothetical protein
MFAHRHVREQERILGEAAAQRGDQGERINSALRLGNVSQFLRGLVLEFANPGTQGVIRRTTKLIAARE